MAKRHRKKPTQGSLTFVGHGGKRRGAGRKCRSARSNHSHRPVELPSREFAAHITLRVQPGIPSLRQQALFDVVLVALTASAFGLFFRIVDFSVQQNHLHLIVEAADAITLTAGMRATAVRIARQVNSFLERKGPVFADRAFIRLITSPRDARNAYVYLFGNGRKHARQIGRVLPANWIDPRSSGPWFGHWADADPSQRRTDPKPVAKARTWLLTVGWLKYGKPIAVAEMPAMKVTHAKKRS